MGRELRGTGFSAEEESAAVKDGEGTGGGGIHPGPGVLLCGEGLISTLGLPPRSCSGDSWLFCFFGKIHLFRTCESFLALRPPRQ